MDLSKFVRTKDGSTKLKDHWDKSDIIQSCIRERTFTTVEILQIDKLDCICCFARRRTYVLQAHRSTRNSPEKLHNQLSHFLEDKTAI